MELPHWEALYEVFRDYKNGLNPYSNGITSLGRAKREHHRRALLVLILILMELPHWDSVVCTTAEAREVLILILMELPHWAEYCHVGKSPGTCLNPYSNGITSLGWYHQRCST